MNATRPTLHLFCGKIAAGKSTLAATLAAAPGTVRIAEDDWLASLYGDDMNTTGDFMRFGARLRRTIAPHIISLLNNGVSVVLDFQANTVDSRKWMRAIVDETGAAHQLHVLTPPDEVCLARLKERNTAGLHAFAPTEAQFHEVSRHFTEPGAEEGFTLVRHS